MIKNKNPQYNLKFEKDFNKVFSKNFKQNIVLLKALEKNINTIKTDPFYPSLRTHKVDVINKKEVFSSRITGDWRLIWVFDKSNILTIICLRLGTHGGGNQVYVGKSN